MNYFFTVCGESNATLCSAAHQNTSQSLPEIWVDLIAIAEQSPISAAECASGKLDCPSNTATASQLRIGALTLLSSQAVGFSTLAEALYQAAFKNDASLFLENVQYIRKGSTAYEASQAYSNVAISCQDWAHEMSATEMTWWQQIAKYDMPYLRGISPELNFVHQCVGWPQPKRNPPHKISIPETLAPKVLLVTNVYDPNTPSAMAVQLRQEIGLDRAVLVARKGAGHTVYWQPDAYGGPTVDAMNRYLLTLEVPDQRTIYDN
jgi:hypothetical protein